MVRRENTFRIDYAALPKKPDYLRVQSFVGTVLGLKPGEVLRIQCSRSLGCAFVKVVDLELAQKVCEEHDGKHEVQVEEGKKIPLRITMEDGAVEVKMFDLSEDVSDEAITKFLSAYGDVISVREQMCGNDQQFTFPSISTGVRIAKMVVKHNIPSWVFVEGESTFLSYFGQRQTCRHCREFIHIGASCVQNKKLLVQKSYADATKQPAPMPTNTTAKPPQGPKPTLPNQSTSASGYPPSKKSKQQKQQQPMPALATKPIDAQSESHFPALTTPIIPISGSVPPSDSRLLTITPGQQPPASGDVSYRPASGKSDGNETDESAMSTNSTRSRGRRQIRKRRDEIDGEREQDE